MKQWTTQRSNSKQSSSNPCSCLQRKPWTPCHLHSQHVPHAFATAHSQFHAITTKRIPLSQTLSTPLLQSNPRPNPLTHPIPVNLHEAPFQLASPLYSLPSNVKLWICPNTTVITTLFARAAQERAYCSVVIIARLPTTPHAWLRHWRSSLPITGCARSAHRNWRIVRPFRSLMIIGLCKCQSKRSDAKPVHKGKYVHSSWITLRTTSHVFTSGYRGVYSRSGKWNAQIQYNGKKVVGPRCTNSSQ